MCVQNPQQRECVLELLDSCRKRTGWPSTPLGDELEELSPMEVNLPATEGVGQLVPVSLETVVTETGVLQLWCVARDGRRWKLEFNVRERVTG